MAAVSSSLVSLDALGGPTLDDPAVESTFTDADAQIDTEVVSPSPPERATDTDTILDLAAVAFDPVPTLFANVALAELLQLVGRTEVQERLISLALGQAPSVTTNGYPEPKARHLSELALEAGTTEERFLIWRAEQALTRASTDPEEQQDLATFVAVPAVRDRFLGRLEEPGPRGVAAALAFQRSSDPVVLGTLARLLTTRPELEGPIAACAGTGDSSLIDILCSRVANSNHAGRVAAVLSSIDNDAARQAVKGTWGRDIFDGRASIDSRFAAAESLRPLLRSDPEAAAALERFVGASKLSLIVQGAHWNFLNFGATGTWNFLRSHRGAAAWHTLKVACAIALLDSPFRNNAANFLKKYSESGVPLEAYGIRDRVRGIVRGLGFSTKSSRSSGVAAQEL